MPFPNSRYIQTGRFTDIRLIGRGAGGQVYYAKDNLGRAVAVKEALPSHQAFQSIRDKFQKESRIQASLQHPKIVFVYHLEEDLQTQELYLICEYVNGGSLADHLQAQGKLTEQEAIRVALDICAALEATWSQQIVHRDIKPSNILLAKDLQDNIIAAKLSDFGIAQDQRMRRTTVLPGMSSPGTVLYAAPEQHDAMNVLDVRADLYALGITLWEMLTQTDYKHESTSGAMPDLRKYNPLTSSDIATVIQRAVQHDPAQRYQTPQAMASDLRDVLAGKSLTVSLTTRVAPSTASVMPGAAPASSSRPPLRVLAGILLLVLAIAGGSIFFVPRIAGGRIDGTSTASTTEQSLAASVSAAPSIVESLTGTPTLTELPPGYQRLGSDILNATFDPNAPGDIRLDAGRPFKFSGERFGHYCRADFPPNGLVWVPCLEIGQPAPTDTPVPPGGKPLPPANAPAVAPTAAPTVAPTAAPAVAPTAAPAVAPTAAPTAAPTVAPTVAPPNAPGGAATADTVQITSISPALGAILKSGQPFEFQVQLHYTLSSTTKAIMAVYIEQFPSSAGGCTGSTHSTNGGSYVPITQGEGDITVAVSWLGDPSTGYVSPGVNFWTDKDGQPVSPTIAAFGPFTNYCYQFAPAAPATEFVGQWTNQDSNTRGITRADIRFDGTMIAIHMWGACVPTDCDWGETTTSIADAVDGTLSIKWVFSFAEETQDLTVLPDGRLQVTGHTHYTDKSGRADRDYTEIFIRS